jgi:hypothetical protein
MVALLVAAHQWLVEPDSYLPVRPLWLVRPSTFWQGLAWFVLIGAILRVALRRFPEPLGWFTVGWLLGAVDGAWRIDEPFAVLGGMPPPSEFQRRLIESLFHSLFFPAYLSVIFVYFLLRRGWASVLRHEICHLLAIALAVVDLVLLFALYFAATRLLA